MAYHCFVESYLLFTRIPLLQNYFLEYFVQAFIHTGDQRAKDDGENEDRQSQTPGLSPAGPDDLPDLTPRID
jgi:hypothetical protein